mmetsp:Transcript_112793/g.217247  ORF Transcript_112793/g.217247 Transcript_112793/m.217247 type:complete len:498 (+) Transcript_112793:51-1544(+)
MSFFKNLFGTGKVETAATAPAVAAATAPAVAPATMAPAVGMGYTVAPPTMAYGTASTFTLPTSATTMVTTLPATTMPAPAGVMTAPPLGARVIAAAPIAAAPIAAAPVAAAPRAVAPAMPQKSDLLSAGRVVSERKVAYEELLASGVIRVEGEAPMVSPPPVMSAAAVSRSIPAPAEPVMTEAVMSEEPAPALLNQAFVFVKPHAVTQIMIDTTRQMLLDYGISIVYEGDLTSDVIDERKLIDQHYYAIASKATILTPDQLPVNDAKFQAAFGIPWESALPLAYNAMDGMQALDSNVQEITQLWSAAKDNKKLVKLGGGFYCGLLEKPGFQPIYVFNAFFMNMRNEYVTPGSSIHFFSVQWDQNVIPWADFRGKVLGPTDPSTAPPDSIRGMLYANWQALEITALPNTGTNGVHASASPMEGLYERMNWLGIPCAEDPFGSYLLQIGVPQDFIDYCATDPQVTLPDGKTGSIWDFLEDSDATECVDKFVQVLNLNMA